MQDEKMEKQLLQKMNSLFLSNSKFKNAFVFEASSGSRKFGDNSIARADYLVEFDPDCNCYQK